MIEITKIARYISIEALWDFLQRTPEIKVLAIFPYTSAGLLGTEYIYIIFKQKE